MTRLAFRNVDSPRPSTQAPAEPSNVTHPSVPASCVSSPVVSSRRKTAIDPLHPATYTYAPSELITMLSALVRARPSVQAPPEPSSLMHPVGPDFGVSAPVAGSRSITWTAPASQAATYACRRSGLTAMFHAPPNAAFAWHPALPSALTQDVPTARQSAAVAAAANAPPAAAATTTAKTPRIILEATIRRLLPFFRSRTPCVCRQGADHGDPSRRYSGGSVAVKRR